ncbi:MAG TPA: Asp-tRNA(Asn)/Glu-tRNA(Gln) amidotransferase GatCAB subunit B [Alphaproteobacteria bacterium]|nr:Asp-tRNA(Asn)/Glu-tRNA(Gln) amidotransferase GatCAB subunit B [Alphaproteobacteria bacterium]
MTYTIKTAQNEWEIVCGLEIHCQIISKSKIFSGASTEFGDDANENVSFIDAGMPGMLPVLNKECVRQAVKTGLGLNAQINKYSVFSRKNYFYADQPNGYQITQYEYPIVGKGKVKIDLSDGSSKEIGITRIHIEQDAAKSIHDLNPKKSYIDFNRAGVGLMEIVTEPDFKSPEEVGAFLKKLRSIVRYLGTCDGNMDEGSMRCDASISVKLKGEQGMRERAEVKNVNSVKFAMQAVENEAQRQVEIYEQGGTIEQQTRQFDQTTGQTKFLRLKEYADDYRYFPEPDLPPLYLTDEYIENIKKEMVELPDVKKERFIKNFGLTAYDADILTESRQTADFFEQAAKGHDGKKVANWILGDLFANLNANKLSLEESPVTPEMIGELVDLIETNVISGKIGKDVFLYMWQSKKMPSQIVEEKGLKQVTDTGAIEALIDSVLKENASNVEAYHAGKTNLFGFFVGQVMKASKGSANPQIVNEILKKKLG